MPVQTMLLLLPTLGIPELLIIFVIIMVLFGASRLPQMGRGLGEGIRNFKKGLKTVDEDDDEPDQIPEKTGSRKA
ncbi:MAG TPA: twin-arginine translocase TatA/TatE family subunit [Thermoanaerobaculia bacterium]|nr:twin-arginine translocase TatA/TatE family subunit [Thermoanaerobaculia bacterium]